MKDVPRKMRGAPMPGSPLGDWRLQHGAEMLFVTFSVTLPTFFLAKGKGRSKIFSNFSEWEALTDPKLLLCYRIHYIFQKHADCVVLPTCLVQPVFSPLCSCAQILFIDLLLCHTGHRDEYEMTHRRQ